MAVRDKTEQGQEFGFTLLEVMLTIGILATLVFAVSAGLRGSLDIRLALADESEATHRLGLVMYKVTEDLQHAFLLSRKDVIRYDISRRRTKTVFRIDEEGGSSTLLLTTLNHRPMTVGSQESDATLVRYEVRKDKENSARSHLYRGESPVVPADLGEELPMTLFARDIKSITLTPWRGDGWSRDGWDSEKSDYRDLLPKMVKIEIEGWVSAYNTEEDESSSHNTTTLKVTSIAYLPYSYGMTEPKEPLGSPQWNRL